MHTHAQILPNARAMEKGLGKTNHVARKVDVKSMLGDESSAAEVAAARPGNKAL